MPMILPVVAEFKCFPVCRKLDILPVRLAAFVGFVRYIALQGTVPVRSDSASLSFLSVFKEKASGQCCFRCFCRRMLVTPPGATLYCLFSRVLGSPVDTQKETNIIFQIRTTGRDIELVVP